MAISDKINVINPTFFNGQMYESIMFPASNIITNSNSTLEDLCKYYNSSGRANAVYKGNCNPCEITLPKGVYLILGMADADAGGTTVSDIMSLGFKIKTSDTCTIAGGGHEVRTTLQAGGGCVNWGIFICSDTSTIALQCYGYMNKTYKYRGWMSAIVIQ